MELLFIRECNHYMRFLSVFLFTVVALAQDPVAITPFQAIDARSGVAIPCVGCSVTAYNAGTLTPAITYTDHTLSTANTNPVLTNSAGYAIGSGGAITGIWVGPQCLKLVLGDANNVIIWTQDYVCNAIEVYKLLLSGPNGAAQIGFQASGSTLTQTVASVLGNCPYDIEYANLSQAISNIPANGCLNVVGQWSITTPIFLVSPLTLHCSPNSYIRISVGGEWVATILGSGVTIDGCTIDGDGLSAGIFIDTSSSAVTNLRVSNSTFKNIVQNGSLLGGIFSSGVNGVTQSKIDNNLFTNSVAGVNLNGVSSTLISKNTCVTTGTCVNVVNATSSVSLGTGVQVSDNYAIGSIAGPFISSSGTNWAGSLIVSGNSCAGFTSGAAGKAAYSFMGQTSADTNTGVLASNNTCYDSSNILGSFVNVGAAHSTVSGGEFIGGGNATSTPPAGVVVGASGVRVQNVRVRGTSYGVSDGLAIGNSPRLVITNNELEENLTAGINVGNADGSDDEISLNSVRRTPAFYTADSSATYTGIAIITNTANPIGVDSNAVTFLAGTTSGFSAHGIGITGSVESQSRILNNTVKNLNGTAFGIGYYDSGTGTWSNNVTLAGNRYLGLSSLSNLAAGTTITAYDNRTNAGVPGGTAATDFTTGDALAGGPTFSMTGCSATGPTGGSTTGAYISGTSGSCAVVVTMGQQKTAAHGWSCSVNNITTPADVQKQTAYSATSATFSGTTVTSDVVSFSCAPF